MNNSFLNDAVLQAKIIKESAIAQARESLLESIDSRVKSIASKKLLEGDEEGETEKEVVDTEEGETETKEGEAKSDVEAEDESTPSDEEIEEIMKELRTEAEDEDEITEEDEAEEVTEGEEEVTEDEDKELQEFLNSFNEGEEDELTEEDETEEVTESEEDDELTEEEEAALEEIARLYEDDEEAELTEDEDEMEMTEGEEEVTEGEDEELTEEEDEDVNEGRLRKLVSVLRNPKSTNNELREAASKIVRLKTSLKKANKVIQIQNDAIKDTTMLNRKVAMFNRLNEGLSLNRNQKIKMINVLDTANNMRELKLAYLGLLEGIKATKSSNLISSNKPKAKTASVNYRKTNTVAPSTKLKESLKETLRQKLGIKSNTGNRSLLINENDNNNNRKSNTVNKQPVTSNNRLGNKANASNGYNKSNDRLANNRSSNRVTDVNNDRRVSNRRNINEDVRGNKSGSLRERLAERLGVDNSNTNRVNTPNRVNRVTNTNTNKPTNTRDTNRRFGNDIITRRRLNEGNVNQFNAPVLEDNYTELRDRLMKLSNIK